MGSTTIIVDDVEFFLTNDVSRVGIDPSELVAVKLVLGDGRVVSVESMAFVEKKKLGLLKEANVQSEHTNAEGDWLTRAEVQKLLKLSRATVEGLLRSSELPASKIGRQWRIKRADAHRFIEERKYRAAE